MSLSATGWLFVGAGALGCIGLAVLDSSRHFRRREQEGRGHTRLGPRS